VLLDPTTLNSLINDGLKTLVDCLAITKYDDTLSPSTGGVVTLPSDFASAIKLVYGDVELKPIDDVRKAAVGSGTTTQYMFSGLNKVQLYDIPATPYQSIKLWYKAYPQQLNNDTDIPNEVPQEYHEALATVYARGEYAKRMGYTSQYLMYKEMWEGIKSEIAEVVENRTTPLPHNDYWRYEDDWRW